MGGWVIRDKALLPYLLAEQFDTTLEWTPAFEDHWGRFCDDIRDLSTIGYFQYCPIDLSPVGGDVFEQLLKRNS
jgi:hypothetical protein